VLMVGCTTTQEIKHPNRESAGERNFHMFYLDYAVVKHSLKGDQGLVDELMEIAKNSPSDVLANFWWERALRHCEARLREAINVEVRRTPMRQEEDMRHEVLEKTAPCRYSYYVDHWDEINQMIRTQYNALKKGGSR
jgi:hypothetical protein